MCYVHSMAQNQNIADSLNIIQHLIEKKNIDDSVKFMFYYVSNLYLVGKGLDPFFFTNYFSSDNLKKEDMIANFSNYAYEESINKKLIVTDEDILRHFCEYDLKKNIKFEVDRFQSFAINFENKTIKEKLILVNRYISKIPCFLNIMLFRSSNEEIRNKVAKYCHRFFHFEKYNNYQTLNSLYDVVGECEFNQITSNAYSLISEKFVNHVSPNDKMLDSYQMFQIFVENFLAVKNKRSDFTNDSLLKIFKIYRNATFIENGKTYFRISSRYFINKILPKIVFYNDRLEDSMQEEVFSELIDSCMIADSRTSIKAHSLIREISLFEIIRNIVDLELDPDNYDMSYDYVK